MEISVILILVFPIIGLAAAFYGFLAYDRFKKREFEAWRAERLRRKWLRP